MNVNNVLSLLNNLTQNPLQALSKNGFNIPQNINNPQQIVQHLLNSGQISQQQVNQAMQMKDSPMFRNLLH